MIADVKLPDGWKAEQRGHLGQYVITNPAWDGAMTVSFTHRNFEPGYSTVHHTAFNKYSGRGWKQRLVNDAVAKLTETYEDEK